MQKYKTIITFLIAVSIVFIILKANRYKWNPHYIDNKKGLWITEKLFSPDSSVAVVYYTIDPGVSGPTSYKSILRDVDYANDLSINNLPVQLIVLGWRDNGILEVKYDPNEAIRLGGGATDLDLTKDTLIRNGVTIIIRERVAKIKKYIP